MPARLIAAAALAALSIGAAHAQNAAQREPVMKDIGRAFGTLNRMNRGQTPYDAAAAKAAFEQIAAKSREFATLFTGAPSPEGSSLPAIWENKADFDARLAKLQNGAQAGVQTADEAGFKTAFQAVGPECGGCHKLYRGD